MTLKEFMVSDLDKVVFRVFYKTLLALILAMFFVVNIMQVLIKKTISEWEYGEDLIRLTPIHKLLHGELIYAIRLYHHKISEGGKR